MDIIFNCYIITIGNYTINANIWIGGEFFFLGKKKKKHTPHTGNKATEFEPQLPQTYNLLINIE